MGKKWCKDSMLDEYYLDWCELCKAEPNKSEEIIFCAGAVFGYDNRKKEIQNNKFVEKL